ncbi:MAG: YihY/virulence factor BrkB family protein [Candidatus Solibacter usitatus]|nr:YihY/virulence factor BrkB family protein [Candidatus Solibacter usitatus]
MDDSARDIRRRWPAIGRYLLSTEAHVYAFAIAANVLLAFWPFLLVMISLFRNVLAWPAAELAIYVGVKDYFPGRVGGFLSYNLHALAPASHKVEWLSLALLLFTANGVFLPLEVAFNRAWGVKVNRSLLKNQVVSMGLIFACGGLALLSAALGGAAQAAWLKATGHGLSALEDQLTGLATAASAAPPLLMLAAKLASIPMTILSLVLVYVYLPNTKVSIKHVLPRAVLIGLALEALKWINLLIWPWLFAKFSREFGVFVNSVTILTWSFLAGLVVLAGAEWVAGNSHDTVTPPPASSGDSG